MSFMLYPDRAQTSFLDKNRVPAEAVESIPLLQSMLSKNDKRIIEVDAGGTYRFHPDLKNVGELTARLDQLTDVDVEMLRQGREPLQQLYENVFNHLEFTGRSGGMFAFEGLGSIYWHMVAKLLLALQENFFWAIQNNADNDICFRLGELYYRVHAGLGFNKTPSEYGAFPMDPYSHTPKHAGAQQPGMTGQVKEEILTRFGELGVQIRGGQVHFHPALLRKSEFTNREKSFRFQNISNDWQELAIPRGALAFTWCQVPIVYQLVDSGEPRLRISCDDDTTVTVDHCKLTQDQSSEIFRRTGRIRKLELLLTSAELFDEKMERS